jgi:hypothetical protein
MIGEEVDLVSRQGGHCEPEQEPSKPSECEVTVFQRADPECAEDVADPHRPHFFAGPRYFFEPDNEHQNQEQSRRRRCQKHAGTIDADPLHEERPCNDRGLGCGSKESRHATAQTRWDALGKYGPRCRQGGLECHLRYAPTNGNNRNRWGKTYEQGTEDTNRGTTEDERTPLSKPGS